MKQQVWKKLKSETGTQKEFENQYRGKGEVNERKKDCKK